MTRYGFMENRRCVDVAIVEACKIIDLGNGQVGLIPTTSMGNSSSYVQCAEKVIVEVNTSQPVELEGMHAPMCLWILRIVKLFLLKNRKM